MRKYYACESLSAWRCSWDKHCRDDNIGVFSFSSWTEREAWIEQHHRVEYGEKGYRCRLYVGFRAAPGDKHLGKRAIPIEDRPRSPLLPKDLFDDKKDYSVFGQ